MADDGKETVQRALAARIGAASAEAEAERWARDYSGLPGFGIVRFIGTVGSAHGLDEHERRRLRLELFGALYDPDGGQLSPQPAAKSAGAAAQSAAAVVTRTLVERLAQGLGPRGWDQFHAALLDNLDSTAMVDAATVRRLQQWRGDTTPELGGSEAELSAIAHAAYLAVCDASGPAEADRALAAAISACEQLAEAREFPPRRLL